jgi:hypothetical protein
MSLPVFEMIVPEVYLRIQGKQSRWIRDAPTNDDIEAVREAGIGDSTFDPLGLRSTLFHNLQTNHAELQCRVLLGPVKAKVLIVTPRGQRPAIPWDLWAKIFLAFGKCQTAHGMWRIVFYASSAKRRFPPKGQQPRQEHVNGGYAIPNNPGSIVIYREEECTRVLVHELLHACGSDDFNKSEEAREVLTESWAELFLIAIQANGSVRKAKQLWKEQAQWIANQEFVLRNEHNVNLPSDYAWRYTVGRRDVFQESGLHIPEPSPFPRAALMNSLRFTSPLLASL